MFQIRGILYVWNALGCESELAIEDNGEFVEANVKNLYNYK